MQSAKTAHLIHKKSDQTDDDQPDDWAQLCAGEEGQGACFAAEAVVLVLFVLCILQVVCEEAVALLRGQLPRGAASHIGGRK